jgi:mannose-6-phosphate isomerase-like protein (cupin superfamily)
MSEPQSFLPQSELAGPIVQPPGAGRVVGVLGSHSVFKVLPSDTGGAYAILEQNIPPDHGPPLHVHRRETEIFYILEGTFEFTVADETIAAPAGTTVVGPRDLPHTFRNVGTKPGRLLLTIIPGHFGNYFLEVDQVPDHDRATIGGLTARYAVEILD